VFRERLDAAAGAVGAHLAQALADYGDLPVAQAMAYAAGGGKRLRGFLVLESARLSGVAEARALWPAAAIEAVHAYSLVHDDLPCMDDDDMRRGQPTVHLKWDEATAVLAGDALQSAAFEMVLREDCHPDAAVRADLALTLARAAGAHGMVRGQALDIAAEAAETPLGLAEVEALQAGKRACRRDAVHRLCRGARPRLPDRGRPSGRGGRRGGRRQAAPEGRRGGQGDLRLAPRRRRRAGAGERARRAGLRRRGALRGRRGNLAGAGPLHYFPRDVTREAPA
jgi:hypothetical protein